ncbi:MAG TPA: HEAT repeat domain-containing protein, partial [Pyrinomonadaceae bacterium]|nr:HEAT repeat domain-containing protein [Pyrinomonadaceae bacterium]
TLILSGLAHARATVAQELSPAILRNIPRVVERLNSPDIYERVGVLDELVTVKRDTHRPQLVLTYDLPASDYSIVVQTILAGNLQQVDERHAGTTWWKIDHVISKFKLKVPAKLLTRYLRDATPGIQLTILRVLETMQAVESAPQIVPLLQSPRENIRRRALATLVSLRAKEAVAPLIALLRDKDEGQRNYALTSLVNVNAREAAVDVVKLLEDQSETVRYWALDALVKFNAREHAQAVWKLTEANQSAQTQAYALAALIYFGETRAIPLAVKRATVSDLRRRTEMLEFILQVKAHAIAPAFVAVLESRTVLGDNPEDTGTDSNIRRDIMNCLGKLGAREAIPVLRNYARGRESNTFLQGSAAMALAALGAREAVDDLLLLLDTKVTGDEWVSNEAGLALAQIGERRTWPKLIDLAASPSYRYRSEIISELNRHLDRELWERIQKQKVSGLYVKSVKASVESFSRESGIPIILDYQPGRDSSPRKSLDGDGYPWANTSVEVISLSYGLRAIVDGLSDSRIPLSYTFIFDDKQVRVLSVERAVEWWRKQI